MIDFINDLTIVVVMSSEYVTLCYSLVTLADYCFAQQRITQRQHNTAATLTQIRKTTLQVTH